MNFENSIIRRDIMTAYLVGENEGSLLTNPGWDDLPPATQLDVIQDLRADLDQLYLEVAELEDKRISSITGAQLQHWRDEKVHSVFLKALKDAETTDPGESNA